MELYLQPPFWPFKSRYCLLGVQQAVVRRDDRGGIAACERPKDFFVQHIHTPSQQAHLLQNWAVWLFLGWPFLLGFLVGFFLGCLGLGCLAGS